LYARVGTTICRVCGREVKRDSPESAANEVLKQLAEGTRFFVLFPARAGLRIEDPSGNGANDDRSRSAGGRKGKQKEAEGKLSRQMITAHLMSLMQRGF